jgi:hypothetical protein
MFEQFPKQPHRGRHLYAVARYDGFQSGGDPISRFVLTRGYWNEANAQAQAERLNGSTPDDTQYFVLPVRVSDDAEIADPS